MTTAFQEKAIRQWEGYVHDLTVRLVFCCRPFGIEVYCRPYAHLLNSGVPRALARC
jgi:hypothetical protein